MLQKTLLPVVKRGVGLLDELLLEFAGPVGAELSEDAFHVWLQEGRTRPSDLRHYADILAAQIEDVAHKKQFMARANSVLLRLQTGFLSVG